MSTTTAQQSTPADLDPPDGTQPLTALTPIVPGRRAALQQVLATLNERIAAGGPTPLDDIGTVHFARWVVLPDGDDAGQLLFTSNFDGPWDDYIEDFAARSADSFDAIYSNCVGWPERGPATSTRSRPSSASTRSGPTSTTGPTRGRPCGR